MTIPPQLLVYFPLLLGIWQETPLTGVNTLAPEAPTFMSRDEIREQGRFYRQLREPELRSRVTLELARSNNPAAVEMLSLWLVNERDEAVVADLLNALDQLRHLGPSRRAGDLVGRFRSGLPTVRGRAMALALAAGGDSGGVIDALADEDSPFVLRLVWGRLAAVAEDCPVAALLAQLDSPQPLTRAGAATVLCRRPEDPDNHAGLMGLTKDPAVMVRAALARTAGEREAGAEKLLAALVADGHASVRAGVAQAAATSARLALHLRLSADVDAEVRRLACIRLRDYPVAEVTEALLARLGDPSEDTRVAAEDSLIALRPDEAVREVLHQQMLGETATRTAAARLLGALRVEAAAVRLREELVAAGDHEFLRRVITSLGEIEARDAWEAICGQKAHPRPEVRRAAAWALGQLAVRESFPVLIELSADRDEQVFDMALTAMGHVGDREFVAIWSRNLMNVSVSTGHPQRRAAAAWALARYSEPPEDRILRQLENVCLKKVIIVEGVPEFDADHARASSAFALVQFALRDDQLKPLAERVVGALANSAQNPNDPLSGLALQVYCRQALDYLHGRESAPEPVPTLKVMTIIEPIAPGR